MPCLAENDGICLSSSNLQGSRVDGVGHTTMTTCSNGVLCKKKVLVSAKQIVDSIKVNVVSAKAVVNMVCGDIDCVTWCTLVRPVVNQATAVGGDTEYAALCNKCQDVPGTWYAATSTIRSYN